MAFPSAVKSHRQDVDNNDVALCVYVTVLICFLFISFFFLAERRGRCIDRNGGLRQRQPSYRSRRQRSARLPSSGIFIINLNFLKMKPWKWILIFPSGDGGGQQVNHPQACYAKICRSDIDCLGGKTERVCCYNGYLITTRSNIKDNPF